MAKSDSAFKRIKRRGDEYLDFNQTSDPDFRAVLFDSCADVLGARQTQIFKHVYPLGALSRNTESIREAIHNNDSDHLATETSVAFFRLLEAEHAKHAAYVQQRIKSGTIEFADVGILFAPGTDVYSRHDGEVIAGTVKSVHHANTFFEHSWQIMVEVLHPLRGNVQIGQFKMRVPAYLGTAQIDSLPVRIVDDHMRDILTERGSVFAKYTSSGAHYCQYQGQLTRSSWWGDQNFRADGRVMVDARTFSRIDSDQFNNEGRCIKDETDAWGNPSHQDNAGLPTTISASDYWRTFPYLYGFSFRAKAWGRMAIAGLSDIKWRTDAYDQLVLDLDTKKMVAALVEHSGDAITDIIEGKGGGCIFLLHGPPGEGKTLTAETIAELLQRPLYAVSVGELGVTPDELEKKLRTILDIAVIWNAVILLDEADIYLEARDEKDIVRNAMVGVFLRLLEYHDGVMFLTTNRVRNIDTAFFSRISVAIHFPPGGREKRVKVWRNLLTIAGLPDVDADELAGAEINGRQIKSAIRNAQTLAKANGNEVTTEAIQGVIATTTRFANIGSLPNS